MTDKTRIFINNKPRAAKLERAQIAAHVLAVVLEKLLDVNSAEEFKQAVDYVARFERAVREDILRELQKEAPEDFKHCENFALFIDREETDITGIVSAIAIPEGMSEDDAVKYVDSIVSGLVH